MTAWSEIPSITPSNWATVSQPAYPIPTYSTFNLLQEDGFKLLQEDNSKILIELVDLLGFTDITTPTPSNWII